VSFGHWPNLDALSTFFLSAFLFIESLNVFHLQQVPKVCVDAGIKLQQFRWRHTQRFYAAFPRLASNAVIQVHDAIREGTRGNQFERDVPMARGDERNPFADH
jgi:hypothetical protein